MAQTCPTLSDVLSSDECLENLAGLGSTVYVFLKEDLAEALTLTKNVYSTPVFKTGKGLYKMQMAEDQQGITSESLGKRKGFSITGTFAFEAVNKTIGEIARGLNNLDLAFIFPDGDSAQIIYDPNYKAKFDSGGIKTDTGKAASDDRQTTCEVKLEPVLYANLYVEVPAEGWDSLLASAAASA